MIERLDPDTPEMRYRRALLREVQKEHGHIDEDGDVLWYGGRYVWDGTKWRYSRDEEDD